MDRTFVWLGHQCCLMVRYEQLPQRPRLALHDGPGVLKAAGAPWYSLTAVHFAVTRTSTLLIERQQPGQDFLCCSMTGSRVFEVPLA
jgi:hypothetical protein